MTIAVDLGRKATKQKSTDSQLGQVGISFFLQQYSYVLYNRLHDNEKEL